MPETLTVHPIGYVRRQGEESVLEISSAFVEALLGVEQQEYLWVLFWMHRLSPEGRHRLRAYPMGDQSRPQRGVFALHSPGRPNPIGMTRVRLLSREGNRLYVEGLDALDGSPIIDIKSG